MTVNRRMWDEAVPLHVAARSYDVSGFKRGRNPLLPCEVEAVGSVRGKRLLHLQCHFGMDTLSWARLGARVTGVDYSAPAVAAATRLAQAINVPARFVESNVYRAASRLHGRFDVVYTGKGALCWLPDLDVWAKSVVHFLNPGGRFYLLEDHPMAEVHEWGAAEHGLVRRQDYFRRTPGRDVTPGTYAAPTAKMRNVVTYWWMHPISDAINALTSAGLQIESFREFPFTYWHRYPAMREDRKGYWHLKEGEGSLPLMYSVVARKPTRR